MAQRGFNIGVFRAEVGRKGILHANKFLVEIFLPPGLMNTPGSQSLTDTGRVLEYYCEHASLPAQGIRTYDAKRYGYGSFEKRTVAPTTHDLTFTFRDDKDANIQKFFYRWLNLICNQDMSQGPNGETGNVNVNSVGGGPVVQMAPYEIAYKDEYLASVAVRVYSTTGKLARRIVLRNAFPVGVGATELSWSDNNTYMRLQVAMTFTDFYEENIDN